MFCDGEVYSPKDSGVGWCTAADLRIKSWHARMVSVYTTVWNSSGILWLGLETGLVFSHLTSYKLPLFSLSCTVHLLILWVPNCWLNKLCLTVMKGWTLILSRLEEAMREVNRSKYGRRSSWVFWDVKVKNLVHLGCKKLHDVSSFWSSLCVSD